MPLLNPGPVTLGKRVGRGMLQRAVKSVRIVGAADVTAIEMSGFVIVSVAIPETLP